MQTGKTWIGLLTASLSRIVMSAYGRLQTFANILTWSSEGPLTHVSRRSNLIIKAWYRKRPFPGPRNEFQRRQFIIELP